MLKQLGKLEILKSADHYETIAKALEDAGFTLVIECETTTHKYYIVADKGENE